MCRCKLYTVQSSTYSCFTLLNAAYYILVFIPQVFSNINCTKVTVKAVSYRESSIEVQHWLQYRTAKYTVLFPVYHCSLYSTAHCISLLTVQHCSLYNTIYCIALFPVYHCSLYCTAHCIVVFPVQHYSLYSTIPCVALLSLDSTTECIQQCIQPGHWSKLLPHVTSCQGETVQNLFIFILVTIFQVNCFAEYILQLPK